MLPSDDHPTGAPVEARLRSEVIAATGLAVGDGVGEGGGVTTVVVFTATTAVLPIAAPAAAFACGAMVTWYWVFGASVPVTGWIRSVLPCHW